LMTPWLRKEAATLPEEEWKKVKGVRWYRDVEVRIQNPTKGQEREGKVWGYTGTYLLIRTPSGKYLRRKPKNVWILG
jgi:hypothetical protein